MFFIFIHYIQKVKKTLIDHQALYYIYIYYITVTEHDYSQIIDAVNLRQILQFAVFVKTFFYTVIILYSQIWTLVEVIAFFNIQ